MHVLLHYRLSQLKVILVAYFNEITKEMRAVLGVFKKLNGKEHSVSC